MATAVRVLYWTTALAVTVLAIAGCSLSPSADVIKALASDPATAQFSVVYPYGTINWCRTNPLNGTKVSCSNSGISIDTTGASVAIPMTITPSFRIAPDPAR